MNIKYRKSLKLIALLITSLLIATVSAVAYVSLQWTMTATVAANPKVCFFAWATPSTKVNTFSYSVNIFPAITTIDENITYGVYDWDTASHSCGMQFASTNTTSSDVSWIYIKVYNGTATVLTQNYTNINTPDTAWKAFTAAPSRYTIWVSIGCPSGATAGHHPSFVFEMKVENP